MRLEQMVEKEAKKSKVKILTLDIETSPIVAYTWGPKWETQILEFKEQSQIICYSAKWLDGKQITKALPDYKGYKPGKINDKKLVKDIHSLMDAADIIVTQNGIAFDIKSINSRFLFHGLAPPSPYKQIDTKVEAKKYLRLPSHKLDDMGEYFGVGRKLEHEGFNLWLKCIDGDTRAWNLMKKYNAQDVRLTEKFYTLLRPFMKTHPNVSSYNGEIACPACGSEEYQKRGFYILKTGKYQRASCNDCGHWYRYGKPIESTKISKRTTSI